MNIILSAVKDRKIKLSEAIIKWKIKGLTESEVLDKAKAAVKKVGKRWTINISDFVSNEYNKKVSVKVKSNLPPWYDPSVAKKDLPKWKNVSIKIEQPSVLTDDLWGGFNEWQSKDRLIIYVEPKLYQQIKDKKAWWVLKELLEHEYIEANIALNLAKGDVALTNNPWAWSKKKLPDAHILTVKKQYGKNASWYDKQLDLAMDYLEG